jgi:hypothetical protein
VTAITLGLDPGKRSDPAALVVCEFQYIARDGPRDQERERWLVRDAKQWPLGTPHTTVVAEAGAVADATGGYMVFDQTGVGETYYDLFNLARKQKTMYSRTRGVLVTSGQLPSDIGVPKEVIVRRFESKLSSGRIVVAQSCPLKDVLRQQMERFGYEFTKKGATTYEALKEEDHDDLLFAVMLATLFKKHSPGDPRYLGRDGVVYAYRSLSHDPY